MFREWIYERKLRKLLKAKQAIVDKIGASKNKDIFLTSPQEIELVNAEWDISLLITNYIEDEAEIYRVPLPPGTEEHGPDDDNEFWRRDTRSGKVMLTRKGVQVLDADIHAAMTRQWERKSRKIQVISMLLSLLIGLGGLVVAILTLSLKVAGN